MPIQGEYKPSPAKWVRDQVEEYERSGGTAGTTLLDTGMPVVVVTNVGAKSGQVRKTPLMRVEHDGKYAAVGSKGGAPKDPLWVANLRANPRVEVQDGAQFVPRLIEATRSLKIAPAEDPGCSIGPVIDAEAHTERRDAGLRANHPF